jgi:predicted component of type VI protein secretion system
MKRYSIEKSLSINSISDFPPDNFANQILLGIDR